MKNLTMILMLVIVLLVSTSSVIAQTTVDLQLSASGVTSLSMINPNEADFVLTIDVERRKAATGVTVTAQLPEGISPVSVKVYASNPSSCAFEGSLIVCNFPQLGYVGTVFFESAARIGIKLPRVTGEFTLTANITANEPDPIPANNQAVTTVFKQTEKSRKRVRFF